jgi:hypothetical protein
MGGSLAACFLTEQVRQEILLPRVREACDLVKSILKHMPCQTVGPHRCLSKITNVVVLTCSYEQSELLQVLSENVANFFVSVQERFIAFCV